MSNKKITLLGNDLRKPVENQLAQIKLDTDNLNRYLNSTNSTIVAATELKVSADLTNTSTILTKIVQFSLQFNNLSETIEILVGLCAGSTNDGYFDIYIDEQSILSRPYLFSGNNKNIITLFRKVDGLGVGSHTFKLLWKVSAGTATVYKDGQNFIQIANVF